MNLTPARHFLDQSAKPSSVQVFLIFLCKFGLTSPVVLASSDLQNKLLFSGVQLLSCFRTRRRFPPNSGNLDCSLTPSHCGCGVVQYSLWLGIKNKLTRKLGVKAGTPQQLALSFVAGCCATAACSIAMSSVTSKPHFKHSSELCYSFENGNTAIAVLIAELHNPPTFWPKLKRIHQNRA